MHVCLSISAQLFCRIKVVPFWVHLNAIPTCVIITNLSTTPIFQDIITNHASGRIVVFRNFFKPVFIGQSRIHGSICYYPLFQVSEYDTVSISYDQVLVFQWYPGWNILWVSNDLSVLIIDRVNKGSFSNSIPFLCGLYSPISFAI